MGVKKSVASFWMKKTLKGLAGAIDVNFLCFADKSVKKPDSYIWMKKALNTFIMQLKLNLRYFVNMNV
jgi:hypothetical protein